QLHRDANMRSDTLTPKMTSRRREPGRVAAATPPTSIPSAAALISFDLVVPVKSSRSGDILSVITRILPAKNSRNRCLWISNDFGRRATAFYFWEGTSATRWDEGRSDREGYRGTALTVTSGFRGRRGRPRH